MNSKKFMKLEINRLRKIVDALEFCGRDNEGSPCCPICKTNVIHEYDCIYTTCDPDFIMMTRRERHRYVASLIKKDIAENLNKSLIAPDDGESLPPIEGDLVLE